MKKIYELPAEELPETPEVPGEEIDKRIEKLIGNMEKNDVDLSIITHNVDRYYFTGTMQNGVLLVSRKTGVKLFVRRTLESAVEESPLDDIEPYYGTKTLLDYIKNNGIKVKKLGLELDVIPAFLFLKFKGLFFQSEIHDISVDIKKLRMIKSEFEVDLLREAGKRVDEVMFKMRDLIKPGVSEKELLPEYVKLIVERESSPCIRARQYNMEAIQKYILSGPSVFRQSYMDSPSAGGTGVTYAFPGGAGAKKIKENEPIMIDLVMNYKGYNSDCTRVFAISSIKDKFIKAHKISRECHKIFKDMSINGANVQEITKSIRSYVDRSEYARYFMGGVKFIGHGIGLELDEIPVITDKFDETIKSGMVVAFEPKFIFEDGAAGYETTYLVNNGNIESLNKYPEDIAIL
ncbi:MAG TPA: aminopeptidase P family protein [Bacteroidetes bacterium]|nr:aminopeptidase P family protein [Bacteroidota bacterium]